MDKNTTENGGKVVLKIYYYPFELTMGEDRINVPWRFEPRIIADPPHPRNNEVIMAIPRVREFVKRVEEWFNNAPSPVCFVIFRPPVTFELTKEEVELALQQAEKLNIKLKPNISL